MELSGIGIFNEAYPPIMDGVSVTVKNYAYWLNKNVAPTIVVTPKFPGYTDHEDFMVYRYFSAPVPMRSPYRIGLPLLDQNINSELSDIPLDILHTHTPFSAGTMALKLARKRKIPIVATFHSKYRDDFETIISNKYIVDQLIKRIISFYQSVDEVWIPQAHVEETLRKYGYKGPVEVVENGVDLDSVTNIELFRQESRKILGFKPNDFIFLFVGQHIWEKNLRFLIESMHLFKNHNFTILFVGEGYAKSEMEQLIANYRLEDKTKFLGLISDREKLKRIYASADLFLFPSLYDNAPLVVREAAIMHTPSLLIKGSTAAEVIKDGINGYLSDNDINSFYEKICEIYCKPAELKRIGANAAQTLCRPWKNIVEEVKDRYVHLILRKNIQYSYMSMPKFIQS